MKEKRESKGGIITNALTIVKIEFDNNAYQYSIAVDGVPLYKYFEQCIDDDISDSVAIPFSDSHNLKDMQLLWEHNFYWKGNGDFIWLLTDSLDEEVLPLLSCPECIDEMDCLLLCTFVRKEADCVCWDRIGRIIHEEDEWDKMKQNGLKCKDVLTEEDCRLYGYDTPVAEVDDSWVSDHWREELFQRNKGFLRNHYKSQNGVKWLKEVNWRFSPDNYWETVNFFRDTFIRT